MIAADAVDSLSSLYPPGHTSVHLVQAKDVSNNFVQAFENGLRTRGFTLVPDVQAGALAIAYTLDAMDEKSAWYLHLRISDAGEQGKSIARAYTASGQPEAGQSRTETKFGRSIIDRAAKNSRQRLENLSGFHDSGESYDR